MTGSLTPSTIPHMHSHSHTDLSTCSLNQYQPPVTDQVLNPQRKQLKDTIQAAGTADKLLYGVEVTQAVQNLDHSVPLVADKPTLVRVYLKYPFPVDIKVSGVIRALWRENNHVPFKVVRNIASINYLKIPANTTFPLNEQRNDLQKSLNFVLPDVVRRAGECRLQLVQLEVHLPIAGSSFKTPIPIPPSPISTRNVQFQATPPLRLHLLGIRYRDSQGNSYEPSSTDYRLIQSWLKRAYPIADLSWSQLVVDAPQVWPFNAGTINAFVRGIRANDVQNGTDATVEGSGVLGIPEANPRMKPAPSLTNP